MKKQLLLNKSKTSLKLFILLSCINFLFICQSKAQTIGNYAGLTGGTFTAASGTFTSISSTGTPFSFTSADDGTFGPISLGFTFIYMGVPYTSCFVNTNGYLSFSPIAPASNATYGPLSTTATNFHPAVCPYLEDLQGSSTTGYFQTSGSAGSRVFTFELKDWGVYIYTAPPSFSLQIKLYEGTGKIEFVYDNLSGSQSDLASIGLTASSSQYVGLNDVSSSPTPSLTTTAITTAGKPASGQIYRFEPPTNTGSGLSFGSFTSIKTQSLSFNWTHSTPSNTIGYLIERSSNAGSTYTTLGTTFSTTYTATGLTPSTSYIFRITPITEGFMGTSSAIVTSSQNTGSCSPMSGTIQIGSTGAFSTISKAIDSINSVGFNGNLILELQNSYSSSGEIFPITIPDYRSNLCTNTNPRLTIRPASGATNLVIAGNNATALFILDNAYKVTFDGRPGGSGTSRELYFNNASTTGTVITMQNDAIGNTIRYCNIRSANTGSTIGAILIGTSSKFYGNDSNTISNNLITRTAYNTTLASGIVSAPASVILVQNDNNTIDNNEIHSWLNFGINITSSLGNGEKWKITNNSFYDSATATGTSSTSWTAISFTPGTTSNSVANIINGNFIGGSAPNCGGSPLINSSTSATMGGIRITCNPGTPSLVQNNTIQNISFTSTTNSATFMGINPGGGSLIIGGAAGKGNTIGSASTANSIQSVGPNPMIGISSSSANDIVISYNTIANITQNQTTTTLTTGAIRGIVNTAGTKVDITNNIIKSFVTNTANAGTTTSACLIGIQITSSASVQNILDNIIGGSISEALNSTSTTALTRIIGIYNGGGITLIKRNKINGLITSAPSTGTTTSSAVIGLYNSATAGCIIDNNEIRNISATAATTTLIIGMYIGTATDITNNIISGIKTASTYTGTTSIACIQGIYYAGGVPATIIGNTLENFEATSVAATQICGINSSASLTIIKNNVLRNFSTNSNNTGTISSSSILGIGIISATANKNITGNRIYNFVNYNTTTTSAAVNILGIYFTTASTFGNVSNVNNNFIHSFSLLTTGIGGLTGIYNASGIATFQNNMIRLGIDSSGNVINGPYNIKGIVHGVTTSSNYYNNNIYLGGTSAGTTNTACMEFLSTISTTETVNLKNNIFYNNIANSSIGRNACIRIIANTRIFSNYNLLYAPGSNGAVGIINTTAYAGLTGTGGWNATALIDGQSASLDPNFVSPASKSSTVDLHLNSSNPAEGQGDPSVTAVVDDFDGQLRSGLTPFDIGADAGNFSLSSEKLPPLINLTPLLNTASTSDRTFTVKIYDNLGLPLSSSSNAPRVYYKKNAGAYSSSAGTLSSGTRQNGDWSFTINASTLGGLSVNDVISYYIIAQDSASNIISNPMYAVASNVNSITANPVTPITYTIVGALSTTIQVGSGQTYTSLTGTGTAGLFGAINTSGLQGNTIVEITSDLTETGAVALNQWIETGGSNYTLTIRPSAASRRVVSSTLTTTDGIIRLNGADRVTFSGIPAGGGANDTFLVMRGTSTSVSVVTLMADATNNRFENCIIEGASTSTATGVVLISPTSNITTGSDNTTFVKCHIRAVSGVTTLAVGIYSQGALPTAVLPIILQENITIRECHIYNWTTTGISVSGTGNGNNWNIVDNQFYRTYSLAASTAQTAINFIPGITSNNNTISGNFIGGNSPNTGGSPWTISSLSLFNGILISAGTEAGTQVQNNTIKNIYFSNTGTLATIFTGINPQGGNIYIGSTTGNTIGDLSASNSIKTDGNCGLVGILSTTAQELTVSNNIIANLTTLGGTVYTSAFVRGIAISNGSMTLNVNNNTVKNLTATSRATGSTTSAAVLGIGVGSTGNIQNILNNTVQNLKNLDNVGAHCMVGIAKISGGVDKIKGNVISGLISGTASTSANTAATGIMGIIMQSSTGNSECSDNKISDLQYVSSTPTSVQMIGILVNSGTSNAILSNNTISSFNSMSVSTGTTSSAAIIGLSYSAAGTLLTISKNTIHSLNHNNTTTANAVNVIGLYYSGNTVVAPNVISRNFVHSLKVSGTGTSGIYGIFNNAGYSTVENNMVRVGIDSSGNAFTGPYIVHGIFQNFANTTCKYLHNSVYVGGSPSSGSSVTGAFSMPSTYSTTTTRAIIKNNIFFNAVSNSGTAAGINNAMQVGSSFLVFSNNNILYANGSGGKTVSTSINYTNLSGASSWQLASGLDLKSGSGDPKFVNVTGKANDVDLHLSSSNPAEGNGSSEQDVTTTIDFDGTLRSSNSPVDIGAHCGNFTVSSDLIAPVISFNPLTNASATSGSRTLSSVSITDNGGIPMTGSSIPRIYFSKNGTTWYSSSAASLTGSSINAMASFAIDYSTLGGVSMGDTIRYYVIAQDNAGNIMSNALYAVASDVSTITSHPIIPLSYKLVPSLAAGTKLRVGTGKTYPTLTGTGGLFEYLNTIALNGDVTAVISSNTIEPGTVALNQLGDNGNATYTLTIRPDSLSTSERLLSGNVGTAMIRLDGADRIKITGIPDFNGTSTDKKLRFRNSSTTGQVLSLLNEAVDNRLHNLNIECSSTSVTQGATGAILIGNSNKTSGNSRDTVSNCMIGNDQTGILPLGGVPTVGIHSYGDVGKENTANILTGNEIFNFSQYGIWVGDVGNGNNWNLSGNSFYRNLPFPAFSSQFGILFNPQIYSGNHLISNNYIGGSAKNCGGTPWMHNGNFVLRGISVSTASIDLPTTISNNVIQNIRMDNIASGSQFIGIAIITIGNYNIINNLLGHPTDINSISLAGTSGHIGILTQSTSICNIRGNTLQGINIKTPSVTSSFLGISLFYGFAKAVNNTIGSATVANSIQYAGSSTFSAIQSIITSITGGNVLIDSNTIANITATGPESGIQLRGILHSGTAIATITNNKIFNLSVNSSNTAISSLTAVNGIGYSGSSLGGTIANNTINNIKAANSNAVATCATGIGMTSANNLIISNNRIYDISNLSTNTNIGAPATAVGINIGTPQNVVTLQNNQISLGIGQTNSPMFIGIWHTVSGIFQVNSYFNSIYIGGTASSGVHSSFGYLRGNNYVSSSYTSVVNAKNNIFMNDRKGGSGNHYSIGNQNVITTFQNGWQNNASNYNLLSNSSTYPIGLWNISDYNFSDWKSNSNNDLNSIYMPSGTGSGQLNSANLFQNTSVGNLSLIKANVEALNAQGKATPISGITKDFDNFTRNSSAPTIGSSEAFLNDVGVSAITSLNNTCGKPVTAITVTLKNFGLQSQSNIPVRLVVSGGATLNISEVVTGPVAPNASISYTFTGTFNSSLGGLFTIKSFTNLSNEDFRMNDSTTITMNMNPLPKPTFTYSDTCAGNAVKFVSTSTVSGGTITANSWGFGDGGTGTGNSVNRTYAAPGTTYTVKIISTSNNGCVDSGSRAVSILSNINAGVIGSNQTICFNTVPSLITNSSTASGSIGPYTYQWQSSADSITFTDISGATGIDYQPGALTSNRWYRRAAKTTSGCGPSYSNVVRIKCGAILSAGTIGSPQTICYDGTGNPITFNTNPTGAFGTYTYQWQQSPDSSTWSNISGQTGTTFTPTNVTSVTYYRSLVTSGSCPSAGSNGVKIKLYSPITGGTIGSGQTICAGYTPAGFTQISAPSGGPGTYTFQWQSSTDSINWNNISGATSSSYSSPAVSGLTYFQRLAGNVGCPSGTSNALKIRTLAKPNIVFTASNHCFNDPMPLSNTSNISSGTLTYLWKFGDGGTSTSSVPNKTYASSGTYNVTLVGTSNLGCKDSLTKSVIVATTPSPSFTFVLKCQGDSAIFTDNTVYACGAGSGLVFSWDFGDGTKSNVQNARKKYSAPGTYNVKFKISLSGGFKDSITKTVVFNIRSTPSFTVTNDCYPLPTNFTNSSSSYASLAWTYGDGTASSTTASAYTKTYSVAGTYSAKLVSTSSFGCKDSMVKTVNVYSKPKATFSTSNSCIGTTTTFNNTSSGANSYLWNFGDGKTSTSINPSNTYASANTYAVKLKVSTNNGCVDSTSSNVTIYPNPVAGFTTSNVCNGFQSSFTNSSTGASTFSWNFGNGNSSTAANPTYTYPTSGNYTVSLTATSSNGCSNTTSQSYTVNSSPDASFTGANTCLGNSITFTNSSTGATTNSWNFGDATTSTLTNPSKTYSTSGNFNVKLVVANAFGCKDSITKSVTIYAKPIPAFTANNQCIGTAVSFTNQSTGNASNIWSFGDGKSSAASSPSYTYASANTYTVKLVVTSTNNCKDSISKSITVFSRPVVSFTAAPDPICRGGLMNFTNTTTNGSTYNWKFGNGSTSTLTNPTNIYNVTGNYTVQLLATSTNGCKDSASKTVTVWPRPVASFKVNDGCTGDALSFATNSAGAVGHEWTFGDGNTSTVANPSKGYTSAATYSVRLIVTSVNGCKDTTSSNVTVYPRASVSFTNPTNFCVGLSTTFSNTSTLSSGTMTYQWNFGDGNSGGATNPTNTYTSAGNYTVKLTATTDKGCSNTASSSVLVFAKPTANFNANAACAGSTVTFNNTTTGGTTYTWDFGDATTSTLASPTKIYATAGTYAVKLTATNANSCSDVFTKTIVIHANPTANFTATDRCLGQAISFTNTSAGANDVFWQFGDGGSSNGFNPSYTYSNAGSYSVILNIESINGCLSSVTKTINVFALPKAAFSVNDASQCINGNTFVYTDNSSITSGTLTRLWSFGDGSNSTATNPTKAYSTSANFNVKLVVTSSNGCKDSTSSSVTVNPKPTANFTINNPTQCLNGNLFSFTDASSLSQGSLNLNWALGDGSVASGTSAVRKYNSAGTYTIRLGVTSDLGCVDSISKTVTVYSSPTASFTVNDDIQCLNGNSFSFTNTSSGATGFSSLWNLGDGSTIATPNASRTFAVKGNYKVTLNISTPFGCKDSAYYTMKVLANPSAIAISGPNTAANGSTQIYSVPATPGSTYNWVAVNGTVLSNGADRIQIRWNAAGSTGVISVTETGENGCQGNPANYNVTLSPTNSAYNIARNAFAANLYPNPSTSNFTIEVGTGDMVNMSVYDQLGREVMNGKRFSTSITVSDHNLASGIYNVKLVTDKGRTTILRFEVKN